MLENIIQGIEIVISYPTYLFVIVGLVLGIIIGAIPGIGPIIGMAILLPLTAPLEGVNVIIMFIMIYLGGMYGGSIAAILINTPGTAGAAATTFDGYPMSKKGRAKDALAISAVASSAGGIISLVILFLVLPIVTTIVLAFGSPEYFLIALLGIVMITIVAEGALLKGLTVGSFGLLITTVGVAPMTLDFRYPIHGALYDGISFVAVLIGLFAISEMLQLAGKQGTIASENEGGGVSGSIWDGALEVVRRPFTVLKSGLIGMSIGAIPGAGGSVSNFIAYAETLRSDKNPDSFGDGNPRGVMSSEASNSATVAGSLIPTLSFGIPGSGTTAVLLGALILHGIQPGPSLFAENIQITYSFLFALVLGNLLILTLGLTIITKAGIITRIDVNQIIPLVIILAVYGAINLRINFIDIVTLLLFGVIGFYMVKHDYSIIALVLGVVLGRIAEANLYRSLQLSGGELSIFVSPSQPLSLLLTISIVLLLFLPITLPYIRKISTNYI
ncbi:tripartite tricarboxylate transporter permease [Halorarum salinum]|uniref:Tripartite tricarboxylate transporter permease n=1 Tax=Halorarum salinum TaxID=2743089 RepID=A0A7D5L8C2_9EURY|nr:tripartite tricarboxylate transporter permease [Halobaculum salinum]QLG60292.1 tripartite tricarboxylate transporter permease [Halobaculum salinum]